MTRLESLYKWLEINVEHVNDSIKIVRVGSNKSSNDTLYGNYRSYCKLNNYLPVGLIKFLPLIIAYYRIKKLPVKLINYGNIKLIKHLQLKNLDKSY